MSNHWQIPSFDAKQIAVLSQQSGLPKIIVELLWRREIRTAVEAQHFLHPTLALLHDPRLFKDMTKALERVKQAIDKKERILIHGDYDVDGISATTILYHTLQQFTPHILTHIPHRLNEGYGIRTASILRAHKENVKLIITVDCGITANDEVALAKSKGIDVIITDHHHYADPLPEAVAIIHPDLPGETYPYKFLSGAGVSLKFSQAIEAYLNPLFPGLTMEMLDLASTGTLSDIVQMSGENRVIAKHGLAQMKHTRWPGLQALLSKTKLTNKILTSYHVGFILGPRINAAGRMGDSNSALEMLLSKSAERSMELAAILDAHNVERKLVETEVFDQALAMVHTQIKLNSESVIVLANPGWHIGVIGIVCSKLVDEFDRPVILIGLNNKEGKGSGRSVDGFSIIEGLDACKDLLLGYGGHDMACGLSILPQQVLEFRHRLNAYAQKSGFSMNQISQPKTVDAEITLSELCKSLLEKLTDLEPYGPGNEEPLFYIRNVHTDGRPRVLKETHLKLHIVQDDCHAEAIWFGNGHLADDFKDKKRAWDIIGNARLNLYQGFESIDIHVRDIIPAS